MSYPFVTKEKVIDINGFYSFFYYEHDKNFIFNGEKHDFWEMVYVDSGEISVVADTTGYLLGQGNIIFHKPMEFHAFTSSGGNPHNVVVSAFECSSPAMNFFMNKIFELNSRQKKILGSFVKEMQAGINGDEVSFQLGLAHLERFLIELMRENTSLEREKKVNSDAKKNIENAMAESIKEYLEENVFENYTLMDICNHYNMSKSYICRLFKNETGRSIIDYYIDLKITKAKLLIRKGELNFTQISEKLGYASIHHFTRSFKSKTGMSPSVYEKSVRE